MEQNIEPATEYYALLFENDGELDDIEEYIDAEERIIELAVGAIYIGELTDQQFHNFLWRYKQESKIRKFKYFVEFVDRPSIPPYKEAELKLRLVGLDADRQEMLDTALQLANAVRIASDGERENTLEASRTEPKTKNATEETTQPTGKPKEKKTRRKVSEEALTEAIKLVMDRGMKQSQAERATGLPQGALSKGKGKKLIEMYERMLNYKEPVGKHEGDDYMHNETY